jgi:hypothetical protein
MTSPLQVDTEEELLQLAGGQQVLVDVLSRGSGPPQIRVEGEWPSAAAAEAALGQARFARDAQAARLGSNVELMRATAGAYRGQEQASGAKLGTGGAGVADAIKLGDIGQIIGPFTQLAGQSMQAGAGIVGSVAQAAVYPVTGVVGAVTAAVAHQPGGPNGVAALTPTEDHPDVSHGSPPAAGRAGR